MEKFIGLNVGGHDSSVAVFSAIDKKPSNVTIILSERLSKIKNQGHFPFQSLKQLVKEQPDLLPNIHPGNIAVNSFSIHPFELENSFTEDEWAATKLLSLEKTTNRYNPEINFVTHHLSHAYSALLQCPFSKALIVVSDGAGSKISHFGEDHPERHLLNSHQAHAEFMSIYQMDDGQIKPLQKKFMYYEPTLLEDIHASDGLGSFFEMVSRLIFGDWTNAGKVMGLAAYGKKKDITDQKQFIKEMVNLPVTRLKLKKDFDSQSIHEFQIKADLAASVQFYFEEQMISQLRQLKKQNPDYEDIILVGGCALNCLLNSRILRAKIFKRVFVPPFPNDEGIGLGAALAIAYSQKKISFQTTSFDKMNPYLGSLIHDTERQQLKVSEKFKDFFVIKPTNISVVAAEILAKGEIIAWVQGRSEVGPRALGNRSILARPDLPGIKQKLNETIKFRENFRPYGATILHHRTSSFFEVGDFYESPFMTFCPVIKREYAETFKGIVHKDGTSRIQTLHRNQNPRFFSLIEEFEKLTSIPILLNTSLNIMNQPILESLDDSLIFFKSSSINHLFYGDYLISKTYIVQP